MKISEESVRREEGKELNRVYRHVCIFLFNNCSFWALVNCVLVRFALIYLVRYKYIIENR